MQFIWPLPFLLGRLVVAAIWEEYWIPRLSVLVKVIRNKCWGHKIFRAIAFKISTTRYYTPGLRPKQVRLFHNFIPCLKRFVARRSWPQVISERWKFCVKAAKWLNNARKEKHFVQLPWKTWHQIDFQIDLPELWASRNWIVGTFPVSKVRAPLMGDTADIAVYGKINRSFKNSFYSGICQQNTHLTCMLRYLNVIPMVLRAKILTQNVFIFSTTDFDRSSIATLLPLSQEIWPPQNMVPPGQIS